MNSEISVIQNKLSLLLDYYNELCALKNLKFYEYQQNIIIKRGIERLLQLLVEVASDINSLIALYMGEKTPESYYDSFIGLGKIRIINSKLAKELANTAGLRNRLVHEYGEYKDEIVYLNIKKFCSIYAQYIKLIQKFLSKIQNTK